MRVLTILAAALVAVSGFAFAGGPDGVCESKDAPKWCWEGWSGGAPQGKPDYDASMADFKNHEADTKAIKDQVVGLESKVKALSLDLAETKKKLDDANAKLDLVLSYLKDLKGAGVAGTGSLVTVGKEGLEDVVAGGVANLQLVNVAIVPGADGAFVGEKLAYTASVKNVGNAPGGTWIPLKIVVAVSPTALKSDAAKAALLDGKTAKTVIGQEKYESPYSFKAGDAKALDGPLPVPEKAGFYYYRFATDPKNDLTESNENDNFVVREIEVKENPKQGANLVGTLATVGMQVASKEVKAVVEVKNIGNAPATGTKLFRIVAAFSKYPVSTSERADFLLKEGKVVSAPSASFDIGPGESLKTEISFGKMPGVGYVIVDAIADPSASAPETHENDNSFGWDLMVKPG